MTGQVLLRNQNFLQKLIGLQHTIHKNTINLAVCENYMSSYVKECLTSCHRRRYCNDENENEYKLIYSKNKHDEDDGTKTEININNTTDASNKLQNLIKNQALNVFRLDPEQWNVLVYTGNHSRMTTAILNLVLFRALLRQPYTAHLDSKECLPSMSSLRALKDGKWSSIAYKSACNCGGSDVKLTNDEHLMTLARAIRTVQPKLIALESSVQSLVHHYGEYRKICQSIDAFLHIDISNIAGLIAARQMQSPFKFADTVLAEMHPSLRGPHGGTLIFYRRDYETAINREYYSYTDGVVNFNTMAGMSAALTEAQSIEFVNYQQMCILNKRALAHELQRLGFKLINTRLNSNMILLDLRPLGITGTELASNLAKIGIFVNRYKFAEDETFSLEQQDDDRTYNGLLISVSAITTRGAKAFHMIMLAKFIYEAIYLNADNIVNIIKLRMKLYNLFKEIN